MEFIVGIRYYIYHSLWTSLFVLSVLFVIYLANTLLSDKNILFALYLRSATCNIYWILNPSSCWKSFLITVYLYTPIHARKCQSYYFVYGYIWTLYIRTNRTFCSSLNNKRKLNSLMCWSRRGVEVNKHCIA